MEKQPQLNDLLYNKRSIFATLRESLVVLDNKLLVRCANETFFERFGLLEREVLGKPFFEIQDGKWQKSNLKAALEKVLPNQETLVDFEVNLEMELNGKRQLQLNAREVVEDKKPNKLILLAIEDVTERNKAIEGYQYSIEALLQTNKQLDQFVHVASHDLQEPLRKILIFSERLMTKGQNVLSHDMKNYLDKIESSAKRMSVLIQDLLDYSLVADHEKLFVPTDLNLLIAELLPDFELLLEKNKGQVNVGVLPQIVAIPSQMEQLFYNLIGNALKFAKTDIKSNIDITYRKLSKEDIRKYDDLDHRIEYVEILVKDNGIGFDQKYGQQIFTLFQRLDTSPEYKGTGIGLALVKRVVENHSGKIFVQSQIGEGAEFHIILPLAHETFSRKD